jgi:hypothetical protein
LVDEVAWRKRLRTLAINRPVDYSRKIQELGGKSRRSSLKHNVDTIVLSQRDSAQIHPFCNFLLDPELGQVRPSQFKLCELMYHILESVIAMADGADIPDKVLFCVQANPIQFKIGMIKTKSDNLTSQSADKSLILPSRRESYRVLCWRPLFVRYRRIDLPRGQEGVLNVEES